MTMSEARSYASFNAPNKKEFNKTAKITKKMQEGYSFDKAYSLVKKFGFELRIK